MTSEKEQFYIQRIPELEAQLKQRDERIAALEQAYNELLEYLPYEAKLNVDETRIRRFFV